MNRTFGIRVFIFLGLYLVSFSSFGQELENKIISKWMMVKVFDAGKDVSQQHNPKNNRWIEFKSNGSFKSDGNPFGPNTGKWKIDEKEGVLFLDSNLEGDDSEWHVSFKNNEMIWTGIGDPRKEGFKLVYHPEKP